MKIKLDYFLKENMNKIYNDILKNINIKNYTLELY